MFFFQFLRDKILLDDRVMQDFVAYMLPALFQLYADTSAKGGDQSQNIYLDAETKKKFEAKDDQSMVSHLLNGIFPALHLLTVLEREGLSRPSFSDEERSVYILAYLVHDIDKIMMHNAVLQGDAQIEQIATYDREKIEHTKSLVADCLQQCGAATFFPAYMDYLEDITYLAINTQQKWGTHLHTYLWIFQLKERRIFLLRRLCTYSDAIAYFVPSPSAILQSDEASKLTTILSELSHNELEFSYHQLREVRGLLTNVVNSGMIHLFTDGHEGIWPYLFFSNGVVYLKRKTFHLSITIQQIADRVQDELRHTCARVIKKDAPGFKFSIKGIAKHPGYYYDFLSLEEYAALLVHFTIYRTVNDITVIPMSKLHTMQANGEIAADLPCDFKPDKRIGIFSRFLSIVFTTLLAKIEKKQQAARDLAEQEIVEQLGLSPYWEQAKTIPQKEACSIAGSGWVSVICTIIRAWTSRGWN